jgi:hypothetical protein
MALDTGKVRSFVVDLLKRNKALTEREVKSAIAKAFKVSPKAVGAAVIRDVRVTLGIDRPGALAYARKMLAQNPGLEAKKVIETIGTRFGIRLGPPDVSRLRTKKKGAGARRGRPRAAAVRRRAGRPRRAAKVAARAALLPRAVGKGKGVISVNYHGTGLPQALAAFFRSLAG